MTGAVWMLPSAPRTLALSCQQNGLTSIVAATDISFASSECNKTRTTLENLIRF